MADVKMFCFQCQETAKGTGCTVKGVCGKDAETAGLQDILIKNLKGISVYTTHLRKAGIEPKTLGVDRLVTETLFATITNANFDPKDLQVRVVTIEQVRKALAAEAAQHGVTIPQVASVVDYVEGGNYEAAAQAASILLEEDPDRRSLSELVIYGLKGMAAYLEHAAHLTKEDAAVDHFVQEALCHLALGDLDISGLIQLVLDTGAHGVKAMALLDAANTTAYGNPEVTTVNIGVGKNPGILISGHDLRDMEMLLEQTEGTGVDVYTHSEMLPAHYYPKFKKYAHFVGNYGNAWWKQREEFASFNGPIVFTTNCIVPLQASDSYLDRLYVANATGYPGAHYIPKDAKGRKDFSAVIEHAKRCKPPTEIEQGTIVGGFAHAQVFALADKVVEAVKSGAIRKFIVMSGCDGRMKSREYYTQFAEALPKDTVILTSGCAKYRYNKLQLGDINGIPRVLDAGQCNDSYSWAVVALKLKEIFAVNDINELPIFFNIAWYEQKAVIVLLALLSLGVKNIHLGPTLPGFLSPNVAKVLVENFGIAPQGSVIEDIAKFVRA